jgi:hypothetical protein
MTNQTSYWSRFKQSRVTRRRMLAITGGRAAAAALVAAAGDGDDDDGQGGLGYTPKEVVHIDHITDQILGSSATTPPS